MATRYLAEGATPAQAVAKTLPRLDGAFALVFLFAGEHDLLAGQRLVRTSGRWRWRR